MNNEIESLSKTLAWAADAVLQSGLEDRQRIALAYQEAQEVVAGIPKDNGDARPRIVASFARSDACRAAEDIACVGRILTALQERAEEENLPGWPTVLDTIGEILDLLQLSEATVH
ncbi:hypothetical protein [Mesorhizobium sp. M1B.F.Ca.ET.045.04.1.1]|uniref:hypothetical protein n=1 Tax=Mesorhizobium sp. M1B.F.Ca.ET.045.04.1.1 TaxID=2493673 RepID=UPI000F7590A4|nr:hypothetical protein [Mesorhizobium sp. M1B.F.Ca.ET.045.04.1.1]AZO32454.1 hypothetical protein EJ071_37355 [Mesorhizobium sp. M1B.F.Ca.ET.045.04.1.1]